MSRKLGLVALMLLLMPTLACAGWIFPSVVTGGWGTVTPSTQVKATGPYTFTLTATSGYTLDYATLNLSTRVPLPATQVPGTQNQWTCVVPLSTANQNLYVYYKKIAASQPMQLVANAGPSPKTTPIGTPLGLSGSASTVLFVPTGVNVTYEWTSVPSAGVTLSSPGPTTFTNPSFIATNFTAANAGSYNVTLKLTASTSPPTVSTATITINVQPANVVASQACINCHGFQGGLYVGSPHAVNPSAPICERCHNPNGDLPHHFLPLTSPVLLGICMTCHISQAAGYQASKHGANPDGYFTKVCETCHNPHSTVANPNVCYNCHISWGSPQAILWKSSKHSTTSVIPGGVTCTRCHNPHSAVASTYVCVSCHTPGNPYGLPWPPPPADLAFHTQFTGTNQCVVCHNPHSLVATMPFPHTNPVTDYSNPLYTAVYITPRTTCNYCHGTPLRFQNNTTTAAKARSEWAKSGKGDVTNPAWKNSPTHDWKTTGTVNASPATSVAQDCVRCHVAKGFTQYVGSNYTNISPVGVASDKTSEPLTCNACHNTDAATNPGFTIRAADYVTAYYNYSSATTKKLIVKFDQFFSANFWTGAPEPNGGSNLCIACHSGRASGRTLWAADSAGLDFSNVGFINSHYMTAAGTLFQSTGFEYYTSPTDPYNYNLTGGGEFHQKIGTNPSFGIPGGDNGPCAGCHMSSANKHSYKAVETDSSGTIIAAPFCYNASCHFKTPGGLTTTKNNFLDTLQTVQELLKTKKGIYYNSALYPYFYTADGVQYKTWGNVQTMGAAFNFNLLKREPGAWAHNPAYTKRLLWDTVDYLDDGIMNQSVTATIQNMPMSPYYWGTNYYLDGSRPNF